MAEAGRARVDLRAAFIAGLLAVCVFLVSEALNAPGWVFVVGLFAAGVAAQRLAPSAVTWIDGHPEGPHGRR